MKEKNKKILFITLFMTAMPFFMRLTLAAIAPITAIAITAKLLQLLN